MLMTTDLKPFKDNKYNTKNALKRLENTIFFKVLNVFVNIGIKLQLINIEKCICKCI